MYLHFPETCILCADLWSFLNTTPSPREKTEKAATYKIQKDPSTKRGNISADGATQSATKQQLNAYHDKKKSTLNQYPNNHHHHIQSHTLDKTQEKNHT
jgi:hypothetical protein